MSLPGLPLTPCPGPHPRPVPNSRTSLTFSGPTRGSDLVKVTELPSSGPGWGMQEPEARSKEDPEGGSWGGVRQGHPRRRRPSAKEASHSSPSPAQSCRPPAWLSPWRSPLLEKPFLSPTPSTLCCPPLGTLRLSPCATNTSPHLPPRGSGLDKGQGTPAGPGCTLKQGGEGQL